MYNDVDLTEFINNSCRDYNTLTNQINNIQEIIGVSIGNLNQEFEELEQSLNYFTNISVEIMRFQNKLNSKSILDYLKTNYEFLPEDLRNFYDKHKITIIFPVVLPYFLSR